MAAAGVIQNAIRQLMTIHRAGWANKTILPMLISTVPLKPIPNPASKRTVALTISARGALGGVPDGRLQHQRHLPAAQCY